MYLLVGVYAFVALLLYYPMLGLAPVMTRTPIAAHLADAPPASHAQGEVLGMWFGGFGVLLVLLLAAGVTLAVGHDPAFGPARNGGRRKRSPGPVESGRVVTVPLCTLNHPHQGIEAEILGFVVGRATSLLVGLLVLVACAPIETPGDVSVPTESVTPVLEPVVPSTLLTPEQTHESFAAAVKEFDGLFPADFELPDYQAHIDRMVAEVEGGPVHFEDRTAEADVVSIWMCAWQDRLLAAIESGDERSIALAADQLLSFYDLRAVRDGLIVDQGRSWYTGVVEPALDGELGALRRELEHCQAWLA